MSLSETLAESLTADRVRRGVDAAEEWVATNGPEELRKPALAVLDVLDDRAEEVALHGSTMVVEGVRMLSMGYEPDLVKLRYIRHHSTPEERRAARRAASAATQEGLRRLKELEEAANGFLSLVGELVRVGLTYALPLAMEALKK